MMSSMGHWRRVGRVFVLAAACLYGLAVAGQESKGPSPYDEEEVSYPNPNAAGVQLAGTMTKPRTEAPVPAVLLISGAGPQDRDETVAGHKPFQVLADSLTRRGLAVLRVDDRGVGQSTGNFPSATTKDFASDAEAGVRYLMTRKDVNQKHIGLIGHGEGAIVAPMVAAQMPQDVAFLVLLGGTAVTGEKVLLAQTARAEAVAGVPPEQIDADLRIGAGLYKFVEEGRSQADMRQALSNVPESYRPFVEPWQRQIPKLDSPWLRFFLTYDPAPTLEQVKCPVLALFGEKDMTLDPEQNAKAMKSAFSKGHNKDAKIKILPGLNYLFQKADTGLGREYATIPETMSPVALETIGSWISKEIE